MSITNERRHQLHKRLDEVLGTEEAGTMIDYMPPVGWADVATKNDLGLLKSALASLETSLRSEIASTETSLRSEIASTETSLRSEIGAVRAEMQIGFAELRAEMHKGQREVVFAMIASNVSIAALALALSRAI